MSEVIVQNVGDILVVDSRLIAEQLGVGHGPWMTNVVKKYQGEIEADFGLFHFENGKPQNGRPEVFCYLTEEQATALMTYSKNTEKVRTAKRRLVKGFFNAKLRLAELEIDNRPPDPVRQLPPKRDILEYVEAMKVMGLTNDPILRSLVSQRMAEEVGGNMLPSSRQILVSVRAGELGISQSEIGTGSQLGKYIIACGFEPTGKTAHGRYNVNCFQQSAELDSAICEFFGASAGALAA